MEKRSAKASSCCQCHLLTDACWIIASVALSVCLSVCPRFIRKTARAINTKLCSYVVRDIYLAVWQALTLRSKGERLRSHRTVMKCATSVDLQLDMTAKVF